MVLSKEEFEIKLAEKEFQMLKPTLIEDIIPLEQIADVISNGAFSNHCKMKLVGFARTVSKLKKEGLPVATTIMLVGNESLAAMKTIAISILVGNGLCSNIAYEDIPKKNLREKITVYGNAFVEFPLSDSTYERRDQLESARFNCGNTFLLFCGGRKFAQSYLAEDEHLFPFYIDDEHSVDEKIAMVVKMCLDFGVELVNNIKPYELNDVGFLSLKQQTYKKLVNIIIDNSNSKLILSDIIESFQNKNLFTDNDETNEKIETISSPISYKDIIGLDGVKTQLGRLAKYLKKHHNTISSRHMVFLGNPGTGKTTMARCLQQELYELGVIKKNIFVETDRGGLCGRYVGETAQKTLKVFQSAKGGVLFIDEAYALSCIGDEKKHDYGYEAITTLVKLMEDNRESTIVIFAGYPDEMKRMLAYNPGLESRIQFHLTFPDYNMEELKELFATMLVKNGYTITDEAINRALEMLDIDRKQPNFSNGRYIRNYIEKLLLIQCDRSEDKEITVDDIEVYLSEQPKKDEKRFIGFCNG